MVLSDPNLFTQYKNIYLPVSLKSLRLGFHFGIPRVVLGAQKVIARRPVSSGKSSEPQVFWLVLTLPTVKIWSNLTRWILWKHILLSWLFRSVRSFCRTTLMVVLQTIEASLPYQWIGRRKGEWRSKHWLLGNKAGLTFILGLGRGLFLPVLSTCLV